MFVHTFESTRCSAVVLKSDVALLSANVIVDKYPQFSGADLFIVTLEVCTLCEILIGIISILIMVYSMHTGKHQRSSLYIEKHQRYAWKAPVQCCTII